MYLIAEIGINHDGDLAKAKEMISAAARSGASAVKFQYRNLDRAYYGEPTEIGDEILIDEIRKTFLPPESLLELSSQAQALGLDAGISFFDHADADDFGASLEQFDFFKVPSAELTNAALVAFLGGLSKPLYLSTGAHAEPDIEAAFSALSEFDWTPLHCISNYPTSLENARLGQIAHLRQRWGRPVGYSSHDDHWEVCLLALQQGATTIERHLTFDRSGPGLDHSSSSTPDEFQKIRSFADALPLIVAGDGPRAANQGELMNRQNLGRCFYAAKPLSAGETLDTRDLVYRAPNTGFDRNQIAAYLGRPLRVDVVEGDALCPSDFDAAAPLEDWHLDRAKDLKLALPVRLHDLGLMARQFPIGAYEFHLSYKEVLSTPDAGNADPNCSYSVHLPDYVNSMQLMDPFAKDICQREASKSVLDKTVDFALALSDRTGVETPIVGSFSAVPVDSEGGLEKFYDSHAELVRSYSERGALIAPQWLPPIAWYFGGSVALKAMNNVVDAKHLVKRDMPVCLDVCHLLLGRNMFGFDLAEIVDMLLPQVRHVHLADALGTDGEGMQFGDGDPGNNDIIRDALALPGLKVIEVWQGHLDRGAGFREAIRRLTEL
ncbi:N-acetylneuraminate synthase family protein [uncultured Roseibium sp.]|uniref:N-acetylneuraminate synthase family protein n=1 Tax=uncultured Roseibium sp. TaxID=1936171 RepID=UPI00261359CB|nr:N-acetylneuraminate synthase family protein [uncultured Roseibium sp.]